MFAVATLRQIIHELMVADRALNTIRIKIARHQWRHMTTFLMLNGQIWFIFAETGTSLFNIRGIIYESKGRLDCKDKVSLL